MRKCPVCTDKLMQPIPLKTIQYDRCAHCGGMWFDAGELSVVLPGPSLGRLLRAARDEKPLCRKCGADIVEGACSACSLAHVRCPGCGRLDMVNLIVGGVEVEVCNPCGGFWLDAGELQAIAESEGQKLKEKRGLVRGVAGSGAAAAVMLAGMPPANPASDSVVIDGVSTALNTIDVLQVLGWIAEVLFD